MPPESSRAELLVSATSVLGSPEVSGIKLSRPEGALHKRKAVKANPGCSTAWEVSCVPFRGGVWLDGSGLGCNNQQTPVCLVFPIASSGIWICLPGPATVGVVVLVPARLGQGVDVQPPGVAQVTQGLSAGVHKVVVGRLGE